MGNCGSTTKRTGMRRVSPASSVCSVKQKHSVLLKYSEASLGATLGTALPTMAPSDWLVASNQTSVNAPGCTSTRRLSALKPQGSLLLTLVTNSTTTVRDSSTSIEATCAASTAPSDSLMPSTCSQAIR